MEHANTIGKSKKMLSVISDKNKDPAVVSMYKHKFNFSEFIQMKSLTQESKPEEIEWSLNQTIKFHLISSALFVAIFLVSALYFAGKINF